MEDDELENLGPVYFKPSAIRTTLSGAEVSSASYDGSKYPEQELTKKIIGCAIRVHKELGAGYVESIYEAAMAHELAKAGLKCERQKITRVMYDGVDVGEHRADLVVENKIVLELKCAESVAEKHIAQVISTLKAMRIGIGLLINFSEARVTQGIRRVVLTLCVSAPLRQAVVSLQRNTNDHHR